MDAVVKRRGETATAVRLGLSAGGADEEGARQVSGESTVTQQSSAIQSEGLQVQPSLS